MRIITHMFILLAFIAGGYFLLTHDFIAAILAFTLSNMLMLQDLRTKP